MSEIVRGRTRGGYLVVDNAIIDGLLEQGSIDLAGFYSALKRFIDRREFSDEKAVMPWTVDMFCKKFGIGKRRFYALATQLWQLGLLDVEKEIGDLDPQGSVKGWRNRYVVHDFPDYEGPLRVVREGSFVAGGRGRTARPAQPDNGPVPREGAGAAADDAAEESAISNSYEYAQNKGEEGVLESGEGYFHSGNTPEQVFGGVSISEIPKVEIPLEYSPRSRDLSNNLEKTRSRKNNNNKKEKEEGTVVVVASPPCGSTCAEGPRAERADGAGTPSAEAAGNENQCPCSDLPEGLVEEMRALDDGLLVPQIMELCGEAGEEHVRRALSVVKQQKLVRNIPALFREALLNGWKPGRSASFGGTAQQESCGTAKGRAAPAGDDREKEKKREFIRSLYA